MSGGQTKTARGAPRSPTVSVTPAKAGVSAPGRLNPRLRGDDEPSRRTDAVDADTRSLPRPLRPFVDLARTLRANGFPVAPEQTIDFIRATGLLGPRSLDDIRRAAIALFAIPPERMDEFNALFNAVFLGAQIPAAAPEDDETAEAHEPSGIATEIDEPEPGEDPGTEATAAERLSHRALADRPDLALARFRRLAPERLPRRRSYRFAPRSGRPLDLRRTLRDAARQGGEVMALRTRRRKQRQRRVVLLIDVSGSMQDRTEEALNFGHTLVRAADRAEVFTLGTRLTRITPALRLRRRDQALARASALVADIDGGTRVGDALGAFLAVPRYAGFARGAAIIVLSDGLERGTPDALVAATEKLARLAWRIDWLSPLAGPGFAPRTEALTAVLPHLDALGDGLTTTAICEHVLRIARAEHTQGSTRLGPGPDPGPRGHAPTGEVPGPARDRVAAMPDGDAP